MNSLIYLPPSTELTDFLKDFTLENRNSPILHGEEARQAFLNSFNVAKRLITAELLKFSKTKGDREFLSPENVEALKKELNAKKSYIDLRVLGEENFEVAVNYFGIDREKSNYLSPVDKLLVRKGYLPGNYIHQAILPITLLPLTNKSFFEIFGDDLNELFNTQGYFYRFDELTGFGDEDYHIVYENGKFFKTKSKFIQWWLTGKSRFNQELLKMFPHSSNSKLDERFLYVNLKDKPWYKPFDKEVITTVSISERLKQSYSQALKEIWGVLGLRELHSEDPLAFTLTKTLNLWDWGLFERMSPAHSSLSSDEAKKIKPELVPSVKAYLNDWETFKEAYALPCKTYLINGKVHHIKHRYYDSTIFAASVSMNYEEAQKRREAEFIYCQTERKKALEDLYTTLDQCDEKGILVEINVAHNAFD